MGDTEVAESLPFRPSGPSGAVLSRAIERIGTNREQYVIWNAVPCFTEDTIVEAASINKGFKRHYSGAMVTVRTAVGVLTGTPNHPVLTTNGWIALGKLKEGQYLVRGSLGQRMLTSDPYIYTVPSRFVEAFNALDCAGVSEWVIGRDVDFHSDGTKANINIVTKYGLLPNSSLSKQIKHLIFKGTHYTMRFLKVDGSSMAHRLLSFFGTLPIEQRESSCHSLSMLGGHRIKSEPIALGLGTGTFGYTCFSNSLSESSRTNMKGSNKVMDGLPILVSPEKIIEINWSGFTGHVYNLETSSNQYIANGFIVHNCQPPHNKLVKTSYESSAIEWGREYLEEMIDRYKPRVILALGTIPIKQTTGMCGDKMTVSHLCGYVLPPLKPTYPPVVATFHPAYLRRGKMSHMGVLMRCLRLALRVASGEVKLQLPPVLSPPPGYTLHPTEAQAEEFLYQVRDKSSHGGHQPEKGYLVHDIETYYSGEEDEAEEHDTKDIRSIQFSLAPETGIYMPWREPYIEIAKKILATPITKVGWNNWKFDDPALRAARLTLNGNNIDAMWMWHMWQPDLPRKLQFALAMQGPRIHDPSHSWPWPYKHLDKQAPQFYGIVDVASIQWMLTYV